MFEVFKMVGKAVAKVSYLAPDGRLELDGISALAAEVGVPSTEKIQFNDFLRSHFFFVEDHEMVISRSLPALLTLRLERGLVNEFNGECLSAYHDAGLVLPPFTIFSDLFQVPALSELIQADAGYTLNYFGLWTKDAIPFSSADDLFVELRQAVVRGVPPGEDSQIICTVSGGADSAVLLSIVCEAVESSRISGLTCRMPGYEAEIDRAKKIGSRCGIEIQVYPADDIRPEEIVDQYVQSHANLVFDPVVPVITAMLRKCIGNHPPSARVLVVEGQGADTVLIGLPHNAVLAYYRRQCWPIFWFGSLLLPRPSEWLQLNYRSGYRIVKVVRILAERNWRHAFLRSLEFDRTAYPNLYSLLDQMLQTMYKASGDRHKTIMLFFLYILQAREAQKYHLLPQGVDILLPFMDLVFMQRCFVTPTTFFFRGTKRKIPINEKVRNLFPGLFSSEQTTPFAVRYQLGRIGDNVLPKSLGDGTYARLKAYSIIKLTNMIVNRC
jgi:hypothetical protein